MDPFGQGGGIAILCAGDDAGMASIHVPVQPEEIQAVEREDRPALFRGESEHRGLNRLRGGLDFCE